MSPPVPRRLFALLACRRKALVLLIALAPVVAYGGLVLWMWPAINSMWFDPAPYPYGNWQPAGMEFEDVWFTSVDGTQLNGWFRPHESPRAVVLFLHGSAGNVTHRADVLRRLHGEHGVAAMTFDYRGFGRSEGQLDEQGFYDDARAARSWLAQRCGISETEVVLIGRSLGGAVAVDLAACDGAAALVLENSFTSLPDVAALHYRWLPVRLLIRWQLDSLGKIGDYHGPLLQSHAEADEVVPLAMARRLFDAAESRQKAFFTIRGADHTAAPSAEYYERLDRFFDEFNRPEMTPRR